MIIRDAVHGDLEFSEAERRVMDTPQFQRLRGVRQTGTAYLVYPGCLHTRFEHSLGTASIARRIVASLRNSGYEIDERDEAIVAMAALVHDVSHLPFGHTFEDERKLFPRHDTSNRLKYFLSTGELGEAIEASGFGDDVIRLLTDDAFETPWMRQIISSTIDADLLDYLRRDAYFAGLRHDYDDRIFSTFVVEDDQLAVDTTKTSTRTEILHLLRLRYFLTERVYYHHAKVVSGAMIAKAVELAVQDGLTARDLYELTDESLLRELILTGDKRIERLIRNLNQRRLLKRSYTLTTTQVGRRGRDDLIATYNRSIDARQEVERKIADAVVLDADQVILYCPDISSIKEARVLVKTRDGLRRLNEPLDSPPFDVKAVEDQYERLWRLYIFAPETYRDRISSVCRRIFKATPAEN
ncbi:MAG: HD domain-containing protein [Candidatus Latescibacterota bacterium]|nr:HD domain-containing protein [Candidatus Latescibacterota bacterium]